MTPGKVLLTSLLLLMLWAGDALAVQKGLILLEDLSHSLDLSYDFSGQSVSGDGRSSSSTQNRFQEMYNFDINYALYNPRIFKGRVTAKLRADQEYVSSNVGGSNSSGSAGFLYNVYGILLERGYTPIKLAAASEFSHVTNSFSPGYDLTTDSYEIATSVRNRVLPVYFDYTHFTTETSGLPQDKVQTNDQISITSTHIIPSISQTYLNLYRVDSESQPKGNGPDRTVEAHRSFEMSLKNSLSSRDAKYSLLSGMRLRDDVTVNKSRTFDWQESFSWKLGRALSTGASYSFATSSLDTPVASTSRSSQSGAFYITHQLFQNLVTRFELTGRQSDLENGTESEYSGNLSFNYNKRLPRDGRLTLTYNEFRTVTDRSLTSDRLTKTDEPLIVNRTLGTRLADLFVQVDSIRISEVINGSFIDPSNYNIVPDGPFTRIVFTGPAFAEGQSVLVSYDVLVNPSIKYETAAHRGGASVALANGYTFYASLDKSDQTLLSGNASSIQLNNSLGYKVGFTAEKPVLSFGAENSYLDSTLDKHNTVEGYARKTLLFVKSRLILQVRDRYISYRKTAANPQDHSENSFNVTANYTRSLFRNALGVFTGTFTDTRGGSISRDDAEFTGNIQWGYGKLFIKLLAKLNWRDLAGTTALEESLNLELKRYF